MAYSIEIGDMTIRCDTAEEALALVERRREPSKALKVRLGNGSIPVARQSQVPGVPDARRQTALKLLAALEQAPPAGVASQDLVELLHLRHAKAMGGLSTMMNAILREMGLESTDVYGCGRTLQGRFWFKRPRIGEAIAKLRSEVNHEDT